jgi:DNA replication and repair protein RecF
VRGGAAGADQLDAWEAELARHGAELIGDRARALGRLAAPFAERARELGLPGTCDLCYRPRSKARDQAGLRDELAAQREDDLARGFTTHGPHRDDLALLREGRPLRAYGSQGQQRLALLALLLAERDVLAGEGRNSLMLLDDVMSEIDAERRALLAGALGDGQTLITATDPEQVPSPAREEAVVLRIETGRASPERLVAA